MAKKSLRKVAIAGMIGNGLEWYDYALYGCFTAIISKLFFPMEDKVTSLILTFGVFAAGFVMRPLGAILFGYIGDKYGRRSSLAFSILLMSIPTSFIGLLPTYEQIGIMAPIMLTIFRLLQGLALGGEFSGSITYIVEHASNKNRNFAGSLSVVSLIIGMLLGSGTAALFANIMDQESFESWGWRVPFIIGFFIGVIGLYIRSSLSESPEYENAKEFNQLSEKPIQELFTKNLGQITLAIGLYLAVTIPFYTLSVFMNSYLPKFLGYTVADALTINTIGMFILLLFVPLSAMLSDKYGNKPVMLISVVVLALVTLPVFWMISQGEFELGVIAIIFFAGVLAFYIAPIPAALVEIFPTRVRYTGMAVACNLTAVFGGLTPIISVWLIGKTGETMSVAGVVLFSTFASFLALLYFKNAKKELKAVKKRKK